jgi:transposase InsO family protein
MREGTTKNSFGRTINISRTYLYYRHKQPEKDWRLKQQIKAVLHEHPSYEHKRLAVHLHLNEKRIRRVMKLFSIRPYRWRGRKWRKPKKNATSFPNLLLTELPRYPNHIWASDFTHISFHGRWSYLATILDLHTREIVGSSVLTIHSVQLVTAALLLVIHKYPHPVILHSDHGSEYTSKDYVVVCASLGITISMSRKGCPWEIGYQESFYDKFKVDLGDPNQFETMGNWSTKFMLRYIRTITPESIPR